MINAFAAPLIGYLLGAIPSAYLIGRLGKLDLRKEGSGHISATAVYRHMGKRAMAPVVIMDIGKGALAIYIAHLLTGSLYIEIFTAYAVVIGHCWSVFLKFDGGLGALVSYGVLGFLAVREFFIAGVLAGIIVIITHKSSMSTYLLFIIVSLILLIEKLTGLAEVNIALILFPLGLIVIHVIRKSLSAKDTYKNELFHDMRRNKQP